MEQLMVINNAIKDIKKKVNKVEISEIWESKGEKIEIYEGNFNMNGVEQPLRYMNQQKM